MLTIMIIFGGLGFLFLSSLSINQHNFQIAFNQSVIENRKRQQEQTEFRDLELQDIERTQNNTRDFLPPLAKSFNDTAFIAKSILEDQKRTAALLPEFVKSINDTAFVAENLPQLIQNTENVTDLVLFLSENFGAESDYLEKENFQYRQANNTAGNITLLVDRLLQQQQLS